MEPLSSTASGPVDEQAVAHALLALIGEGRVAEARHLLLRLDPNSPLWARFASVLAPPRAFATTSASGQSLSGQAEALAGDLSAYRGQWAALRDGQVIDSDADRGELRRRLKDVGRLSDTLFVRL